jgi:iron complex outermembrane receptor protein
MKRTFTRKCASVSLALLALGVSGTANAADNPSTPNAQNTPALSKSSTLYGIVRSQKDQKLLGGVSIILHNKKNDTSILEKTNSQGGYLFTDLPPGDYEILVGGGNFSQSRKEGFLKAGMTGEIDFAIQMLSRGSSTLLGTITQKKGDS